MARQNRALRHTAFVLSLLAVTGPGCGKKTEKPSAPLIPVTVTKVLQKDMPVYKEFVGQTVGYQDVEIRARVAGYLDSMNFKEGAFVTKGQLLYKIDDKPFIADLEQAKGRLGEAKAKLEKTQKDVDRYGPLAAAKAISQQELDDALAALDAAKAGMDTAQAEVDTATINLGYTRIEAPLDGLIDVTSVKPGNLVGRNENTLLNTISCIDPIDVRISLTESEYLMFAKRKLDREADSETEPQYSLELILANGFPYPFPGTLDVIERAVDPTTGTLSLKISFPNPKKVLRPGQFAKIRGIIKVKKDALLVPQRAVSELQGKFQIAVVGADNKVDLRTVTTGERFENLWQIEEGLHPGETVIVEGLQKVRDGSVVTPTWLETPQDAKPTTV